MSRRKKRIDKHVIADMSVHHVGWFVAAAGYTYLTQPADYGIDVFITTFDQNGEVENGVVYLQLKATRTVKRTSAGYKFRVSRKDADYWAATAEPVYLVLYDVRTNEAFALYFQHYVETNRIDVKGLTTASFNVLVPATAAVDIAAVRQWRGEKNRIMTGIGKVTHV